MLNCIIAAVKYFVPKVTTLMTLLVQYMSLVLTGEMCRSRMNGFRVFVSRTEDTSNTVPVFTSIQDEPGPIIRVLPKKGTYGR